MNPQLAPEMENLCSKPNDVVEEFCRKMIQPSASIAKQVTEFSQSPVILSYSLNIQ